MKKTMTFLSVLGLVLLFSVNGFAGVDETAPPPNAGKYAEARAEYEVMLKEAPSTDSKIIIMRKIKATYLKEKNITAAKEELAKMLVLKYNVSSLAPDQATIGDFYYAEGDYTAAIEEYTKALTMGNAGSYRSYAQWQIGVCLEKQGKIKEAQEAYTKILFFKTTDAWAKQIRENANNKINRTLMGKDKYVKLLNDLLLVTPATANNAEWLGFIKSELAKFQ